MFLNNQQSLLLSGIVALCFFVAGVFGILNNYMVISLIVIGFIVLIINMILAIRNKKNPE